MYNIKMNLSSSVRAPYFKTCQSYYASAKLLVLEESPRQLSSSCLEERSQEEPDRQNNGQPLLGFRSHPFQNFNDSNKSSCEFKKSRICIFAISEEMPFYAPFHFFFETVLLS